MLIRWQSLHRPGRRRQSVLMRRGNGDLGNFELVGEGAAFAIASIREAGRRVVPPTYATTISRCSARPALDIWGGVMRVDAFLDLSTCRGSLYRQIADTVSSPTSGKPFFSVWLPAPPLFITALAESR